MSKKKNIQELFDECTSLIKKSACKNTTDYKDLLNIKININKNSKLAQKSVSKDIENIKLIEETEKLYDELKDKNLKKLMPSLDFSIFNK